MRIPKIRGLAIAWLTATLVFSGAWLLPAAAVPSPIDPGNGNDIPDPGNTPGSPYRWQGALAGVKTNNGNKLTQIPLVGWTARGGLPVAFVLSHNSGAGVASPFGAKWLCSYNAWLTFGNAGKVTVHWDEGSAYTFTQSNGIYRAPTGIYDTLVAIGSPVNAYEITTKSQVTYRFTNAGGWRLTQIRDLNNNQINLTHVNGRLRTIADPTERTLTLNYNSANKVTSLSDPLGRQWVFSYDGSGRLSYIRWPNITIDRTVFQYGEGFDYDVFSNINRYTDKRGKAWTMGYNENHIAWMRDPLGNTTHLTYGDGYTDIEDSSGRVTRHYYADGRLTSTRDDYSWSATPALDDPGFLSYGSYSTQTPVGSNIAVWELLVDNNTADNQAVVYLEVVDATDNWTPLASRTVHRQEFTGAFRYQRFSLPFTLNAARAGHNLELRTYWFDAAYTRLRSVVVNDTFGWDALQTAHQVGRMEGAGASAHYAYDGQNNLTTVVDRRNHEWVSTYDERGNRLSAKEPNKPTPSTWTYNGFNQVLTATDPLDHTATFTYDERGNLRSAKDALDHTTWFTPNAYGLMRWVTDALNHTTEFDHDTHGNVTRVTDANSLNSWAGYDLLGRQTSVANNLNHTVVYGRDNWGRVTKVTFPDTKFVETSYDANNNVERVTDANLNSARSTYDDANRPLTSSNGRGDTTRYGYDNPWQRGMLWSKTNGNNKITYYRYTPRYELGSVSYPDGTDEAWSYDPNGNLNGHKDGNDRWTGYGYDAANRLTHVDYPAHDNPVWGTDTYFGYDNAGRRSWMTDLMGTTTWGYDNADRLTQVATPQGTVDFGYDDANRPRNRSLHGTGTWWYAYDNGNRLHQTTTPFNETTTFYYDGASRLQWQHNGNATWTNFAYDANSRVSDVWHERSNAFRLATYRYGYDAGGRVIRRSEDDGSVTTFGYDQADQLTSEQRQGPNGYTIGYSYDNNGNRLSKTLNGQTEWYGYDDHDKLLWAGNKSYGYDGAGNLRHIWQNGQLTHDLHYDFAQRLVHINYPASGQQASASRYNGLGLRVQRIGSGYGSNLMYSGADVGSGLLRDNEADRVYTPGLSERHGQVSRFYHGDLLGSARGLSDSGEAVTDGRLFDAFGMTLSRWGDTNMLLGFAASSGYQTDEDSGFQLLGHRFYDPSVGRFLTPDPIGSGRNWYAYASNNPLSFLDPLGLADEPVSLEGGQASGGGYTDSGIPYTWGMKDNGGGNIGGWIDFGPSMNGDPTHNIGGFGTIGPMLRDGSDEEPSASAWNGFKTGVAGLASGMTFGLYNNPTYAGQQGYSFSQGAGNVASAALAAAGVAYIYAAATATSTSTATVELYHFTTGRAAQGIMQSGKLFGGRGLWRPWAGNDVYFSATPNYNPIYMLPRVNQEVIVPVTVLANQIIKRPFGIRIVPGPVPYP